MAKLVLDAAGYENYLADIAELEEKLSKLRRFKGEVAVHEGNVWHDNFTFEQAENEERMLMREISNRYKLLAEAEIVEVGNSLGVELNDIVSIELNTEYGVRNMIVKLVSTLSDKGDEIKEITLNSPMGQAIYQKEPNAAFSYSVNGRILTGTIMNIEKPILLIKSREE